MSERSILEQFGCWFAAILSIVAINLAYRWLTGRTPSFAIAVASYALFRTFAWKLRP